MTITQTFEEPVEHRDGRKLSSLHWKRTRLPRSRGKGARYICREEPHLWVDVPVSELEQWMAQRLINGLGFPPSKLEVLNG